jgi:hypothetical protein
MFNKIKSKMGSLVAMPRGTLAWILGVAAVLTVGCLILGIVTGDTLLLLLALLLVFLPLGIILIILKRKHNAKRGQKLARALAEEMRGGAPTTAALKQAAKDIREQWEKGITALANEDVNLYEMPWYCILGEPASGKTTLLQRSGIQFLLGSNPIPGGRGTRNCDFLFSREAVLIDTAGRFSFPQPGTTDESEWEEFLRLLARHRPLCPINGVIVSIPCTSILEDDATQRKEKASIVNKRLKQMQRELGIQFPVYILLTKCDRILGFTEFFSKLPAMKQEQILGWTNTKEFTETVSRDEILAHLGRISDHLKDFMLNLLSEDVEVPDRDPIFFFPQEFKSILPVIGDYCEGVFQQEFREEPLFFRGIYFSSGIQQGKPIAKACAKILSEASGEDSSLLKELESVFVSSRPFFISDLFKRKIFPEEGMITPTKRRKRFVKKVQTGLNVGLVVYLLLLVFMLVFGGFSVISNCSDVREQISESKEFLERGDPESIDALMKLHVAIGEYSVAMDSSVWVLLNPFVLMSDKAEELGMYWKVRFCEFLEDVDGKVHAGTEPGLLKAFHGALATRIDEVEQRLTSIGQGGEEKTASFHDEDLFNEFEQAFFAYLLLVRFTEGQGEGSRDDFAGAWDRLVGFTKLSERNLQFEGEPLRLNHLKRFGLLLHYSALYREENKDSDAGLLTIGVGDPVVTGRFLEAWHRAWKYRIQPVSETLSGTFLERLQAGETGSEVQLTPLQEEVLYNDLAAKLEDRYNRFWSWVHYELPAGGTSASETPLEHGGYPLDEPWEKVYREGLLHHYNALKKLQNVARFRITGGEGSLSFGGTSGFLEQIEEKGKRLESLLSGRFLGDLKKIRQDLENVTLRKVLVIEKLCGVIEDESKESWAIEIDGHFEALMKLLQDVDRLTDTRRRFKEDLATIAKDQTYPLKVLGRLSLLSRDAETLYRTLLKSMEEGKDNIAALKTAEPIQKLSSAGGKIIPEALLGRLVDALKRHIDRFLAYKVIQEINSDQDILGRLAEALDGAAVTEGAVLNDDYVRDLSNLIQALEASAKSDGKGLEDTRLADELTLLKSNYIQRYKMVFLGLCRNRLSFEYEGGDQSDWRGFCRDMLDRLDLVGIGSSFNRLKNSAGFFLKMYPEAGTRPPLEQLEDAFGKDHPAFLTALRFVVNKNNDDLIPDGKGELHSLRSNLAAIRDSEQMEFVHLYHGFTAESLDPEGANPKAESAKALKVLSERWNKDPDLKFIGSQMSSVLEHAMGLASQEIGEFFEEEIRPLEAFSNDYPVNRILKGLIKMDPRGTGDPAGKAGYLDASKKDVLKGLVDRIYSRFEIKEVQSLFDTERWDAVVRIKHLMDSLGEGYRVIVTVDPAQLKNFSFEWEMKVEGVSVFRMGEEGDKGRTRIEYQSPDVVNFFTWKPLKDNIFLIYFERGNQYLCLGTEGGAVAMNNMKDPFDTPWAFLRFLGHYHHLAAFGEPRGDAFGVEGFRVIPDEGNYVQRCEIDFKGKVKGEQQESEIKLEFKFDPALPVFVDPEEFKPESVSK